MAETSSSQKSELSTALRGHRLRRGWRPLDIAARCGIHPATISRIERGDVVPNRSTLRLVERALGHKVGELEQYVEREESAS